MARPQTYAFCQAGPLPSVILSQIFDRQTAGWRLIDSADQSMKAARSLLDNLSSSGIRIAARSGAISHALTVMMKSSHRWSSGNRIAFSLRRALTRRALDWVLKHVKVLEAEQQHVEQAGDLWFAHYREELHRERAGFDDYVDAALLLDPPPRMRINHVLVDHNHLPYVLGKCRANVTPHYLSEIS